MELGSTSPAPITDVERQQSKARFTNLLNLALLVLIGLWQLFLIVVNLLLNCLFHPQADGVGDELAVLLHQVLYSKIIICLSADIVASSLMQVLTVASLNYKFYSLLLHASLFEWMLNLASTRKLAWMQRRQAQPVASRLPVCLSSTDVLHRISFLESQMATPSTCKVP